MKTIVTEWKAPSGRTVTPGTELTIEGEKGRFRFVRLVITDTSKWIDVIGGKVGHEKSRSFRPERVEVVHRIAKMR